MEFSAEWKSRWTISSAFSPPLLLSNKNTKTPFGPLIFNPDPKAPITQILHSPALSPRLPLPYPNLFLSRFLRSYDSIPSSAASISSFLGPQLPDHSSFFHGFNCLELLPIPDKDLVVAFFPTGENSDRLGFASLSVKDGKIGVHSHRENFFQQVKEGCVNRQRITRLLVNQVDDFCGDILRDDSYGEDAGNVHKRNGVVVIGLLMVCTNYSVYWYRIGLDTFHKQNEFSVCLEYLGFGNAKNFKGNAVANACWSQHLRHECLVLLVNGALLLFDIDYSSQSNDRMVSLFNGKKRAVHKRLQLLLNDKVDWEEADVGKSGWFGCAFSWHPRIFIISHCNAVFLVDMRSRECDVLCLLKLEPLLLVKNDNFVAFSRVASDGFYFTVATSRLLLLCDVRKPLMPVLRWAHSIPNPHYMTVFRLSELRANANKTNYEWASESGHCILLGSFWDCEFCLFCYGPGGNEKGTVSSEISQFCNAYYAWGLPSEFSLSGFDCNCGSCLVREEFSRVSLPIWIDWRQKKDVALGFGILDSNLSSQFSITPSSVGGFTLIRLTSSGMLEAQHYIAVWESEKFLEVGPKRKSIFLEDNLLYDRGDLEYDGLKKFKHLKYGCLNAFLSNKLARYILTRIEEKKESCEDAEEKKFQLKLDYNFHEEICEKLKALGLHRVRSPSVVSVVLKDIRSPTSINEVASRITWGALPTEILRLGFCTYSEFHKDGKNNEPLEFLDIPNQVQMPPFLFGRLSCRSNKWSSKVKPSNNIVGPVLSSHFLSTFHKLKIEELKKEKEMYWEETEEFSSYFQFKKQCDKVVGAIEEHILGSHSETHDNDFVSANNSTDSIHGTQILKLSQHIPSAFSEKFSDMGLRKSMLEDNIFIQHAFKRSHMPALEVREDMKGPELFDVGCPVELRLVDSTFGFVPEELEQYQILMKHQLQFQKSFQMYQDHLS